MSAEDLAPWAAILIAAGLVLFSGLFSGLTLGLLSLDIVGLRTIMEGGLAKDKEYAAKILPVRKRGNLLLCTLLLGNTCVNSAVSIILTGVTSGAVGLLVSTFVILLFGEIGPQAAFSRHSLAVGATLIPVVKFFIVLFFPITFPIAFVLDKVLGRDLGTMYTIAELKRLIEIHIEDPEAQKESGLTATDQRLLTGIFEYKGKMVRDVMTKLEDCFMLEKGTKLNFQSMSKIYMSGCSRVPIYNGDRGNIIGILFVKDLILIDPDDEMEVSSVMAFRGRNVVRVYDNVTLDKVFTKFMATANHMLIAHAPPDAQEIGVFDGPFAKTSVTGLITLEDVLEEMIKSEIYDESDVTVDAGVRTKERLHRADVSIYLNLFEHKMRGLKLSSQEVAAVAAFLALNIEEFYVLSLSEMAFKSLIVTAEVLERGTLGGNSPNTGSITVDDFNAKFADSASTVGSCAAGRGLVLYEHGHASPYFTLILQGKVLIKTGSEGFELELGPWSHLGNRAMSADEYIPDFDALALPPFRLLRIHRGSFLAALDAVRLESVSQYQAVKQQMRMAADGGTGALATGALHAVPSLSHLVDPKIGAPDSRNADFPPHQSQSSSFSDLSKQRMRELELASLTSLDGRKMSGAELVNPNRMDLSRFQQREGFSQLEDSMLSVAGFSGMDKLPRTYGNPMPAATNVSRRELRGQLGWPHMAAARASMQPNQVQLSAPDLIRPEDMQFLQNQTVAEALRSRGFGSREFAMPPGQSGQGIMPTARSQAPTYPEPLPADLFAGQMFDASHGSASSPSARAQGSVRASRRNSALGEELSPRRLVSGEYSQSRENDPTYASNMITLHSISPRATISDVAIWDDNQEGESNPPPSFRNFAPIHLDPLDSPPDLLDAPAFLNSDFQRNVSVNLPITLTQPSKPTSYAHVRQAGIESQTNEGELAAENFDPFDELAAARKADVSSIRGGSKNGSLKSSLDVHSADDAVGFVLPTNSRFHGILSGPML